MCLTLLTLALASVPGAPKRQLHLDVHSVQADAGCYPSGLKVIGVSRPDSGVATTVWLSGKGKSADPEGQGGSVHLLEHLFYRSRPNDGGSFRDATSGLEITAQTWNDTGLFAASSAVGDLEQLVEMHGWVFAAPLHGVSQDVQAAIGKVTAADVAELLVDCAGHEAVTAVGYRTVEVLEQAGLEPERVDWRAIGAEVIDSLR